MLKLSYSEENYLKAIYHLSDGGHQAVTTNGIAEVMETKAASVTDMVKRLASKSTVDHEKYKGVTITKKGKGIALQVIRKHRLWEVFLVDKLKFQWDEVHDIAEQLEHIKSPLLIKKLDAFLKHPKVDPHGDPIPDENGEFDSKPSIPLSEMQIKDSGIIVGVNDSSSSFLKYLDRVGAYIGAEIKILDKIEYDSSMELSIDGEPSLFVSDQVSANLLIMTK